MFIFLSTSVIARMIIGAAAAVVVAAVVCNVATDIVTSGIYQAISDKPKRALVNVSVSCFHSILSITSSSIFFCMLLLCVRE